MISSGCSVKSKTYSAVKTRLMLVDLVLTFCALMFFQLFFSRNIQSFAAGTSSFFYVECLVYTLIFMAFMYVVSLPVNIASTLIVERHFGLTERGVCSWLVDEIKSVILSLLLYSICSLVFYYFLRNFPGTWWIITAFLWILFTLIMARYLPVLLIPVFYKYSPIDDKDLKADIISLSEDAGISLVDVSQIDLSKKTKKANAALVGMGTTRRVILADTLINGFSKEEILTVVAHELAHHKKKHILKLLAWASIMTLISFYILYLFSGRIASVLGASSPSDLFLLPSYMILFSVFALFILPFQNFLSRALEREADDIALETTGDPGAFVSVMRKLAEMNLSDADPGNLKKIFLYDHPPISERIKRAEIWTASR